MKRWKMFVLFNAASLVGALLAIFTLPGRTLLRIWEVFTIGTVTVLNFLLYRRTTASQIPLTDHRVLSFAWACGPPMGMKDALLRLTDSK